MDSQAKSYDQQLQEYHSKSHLVVGVKSINDLPGVQDAAAQLRAHIAAKREASRQRALEEKDNVLEMQIKKELSSEWAGLAKFSTELRA